MGCSIGGGGGGIGGSGNGLEGAPGTDLYQSPLPFTFCWHSFGACVSVSESESERVRMRE